MCMLNMVNHLLKEKNLNKLKNILFSRKSSTKKELAVASGLSTVTVNSLVKDLIGSGEFIEGEPIQQKMGRPALNYYFNYNFQHYLLISIQEMQTELYAMVKITNMLGEIKKEKTYALEDTEIASVIMIVEEMIQLESSIESIGISIPGKVKEDVVVVSSYEKLNGWNLKKEIQKKWDIAVQVENDANLATVGYCMTNKIPQSESVIGIYYPEKSMPGASVFSNHQLFMGQHGLAGEIKYLPHFIEQTAQITFEESVEKLIETICLYNSILAPHAFVIHMNRLNQHTLEKYVFENRVFGLQPNKPEFYHANSFDDDIISGLQWSVMSTIVFIDETSYSLIFCR